MARTWNLRLNLDELNAANLTGMTDAIRSDLWTGLVFGCNGLDIPEGSSKHLRSTFEIGSAWRAEAEAHKERMSLGGQASAESRKLKTGSAQPPKHRRSTFEAPSEGSSNQSNIFNPLKDISTTETKATSPSRARKSAGKKDEPLPPPEALLPKLATIAKDWPRRSDYKGQIAVVSVLARPLHVWERVVKFVPEQDRALAVDCGLVYLDELDTREKGVDGLIPNVCAMTNFYGEAALWKKMIAKIDEVRALRGQA